MLTLLKKPTKPHKREPLTPAAESLLMGVLCHGSMCTHVDALTWLRTRFPKDRTATYAIQELTDLKYLILSPDKTYLRASSRAVRFLLRGMNPSPVKSDPSAVARQLFRFKLASINPDYVSKYFEILIHSTLGTSVDFIQGQDGLEAVHVLAPTTQLDYAVGRCTSRVRSEVKAHHIFVTPRQWRPIEAQAKASEHVVRVHIHNEYV